MKEKKLWIVIYDINDIIIFIVWMMYTICTYIYYDIDVSIFTTVHVVGVYSAYLYVNWYVLLNL